MRLIAYDLGVPGFHLVPAQPQRYWMDRTPDRYAYRCLPLTMANTYGWWVVTDQEVTAEWMGGQAKETLTVSAGALSYFGSGIVTFSIPYLIRTEPGWNLWVRGPANWLVRGAQALDGIVETDWSPATFTMNWQMVDRFATWEAGTPIAQIFPIRRGELEGVIPVLKSIQVSPEEASAYSDWNQSRTRFNQALQTGQAMGWQKHYTKGQDPSGQVYAQHQTQNRVRPFQEE